MVPGDLSPMSQLSGVNCMIIFLSIVHEDITTIYTDRSNSPDPASEASTNYTYPVEQEFWNIEDIDDPQGSHARWKQVYMQLHMRSVEEPPPQRIARMQQNRPLNRYVIFVASLEIMLQWGLSNNHFNQSKLSNFQNSYFC